MTVFCVFFCIMCCLWRKKTKTFLNDTATCQVVFKVSLFWSWNSLLWRSSVAFTYRVFKS